MIFGVIARRETRGEQIVDILIILAILCWCVKVQIVDRIKAFQKRRDVSRPKLMVVWIPDHAAQKTSAINDNEVD